MENMDMEIINQLIEELFKLKGPQLVVVFLIMTGYLLKMIPKFPNRYIPFINIGVAGILSPFLVAWPSPQSMDHDIRYIEIAAWLQSIISGFLLGIVAWICHAKLLKKYVDDKIPAWNKDKSVAQPIVTIPPTV